MGNSWCMFILLLHVSELFLYLYAYMTRASRQDCVLLWWHETNPPNLYDPCGSKSCFTSLPVDSAKGSKITILILCLLYCMGMFDYYQQLFLKFWCNIVLLFNNSFALFFSLYWTCIGGRRFKDKKEVVEPEADPERDQRTVFAYQVICIYVFEMQVSINVINVFCLFALLLWIWWWQMPLKATERDVYEFFSRAGKVGGILFLHILQIFRIVGFFLQ